MPLTAWMSWTVGCEAKSTLTLDDPLPFMRSTLFRFVGRHTAEQETGFGAAAPVLASNLPPGDFPEAFIALRR